MTTLQYLPACPDIRALLGVSIKELKDEIINLPVYVVQIEESLGGVHPELQDKYEELKEKLEKNKEDPTNNPPLTRPEKRLVGSVQVYMTYSHASLLAPALPMFGVKKITDGKAAGERSDDAWKSVQESLEANLAELAETILENLEDLGIPRPVVTAFMPFGTATIGIDPVTGE